MPPTVLKKEDEMTTKYQIHGYDKYMSEDYINATLYDTYEAAFALAHSNHEWVVKVEPVKETAEA